MAIPRWLSVLLVAALLLSAAPAAVLATPAAPAAEQAPTVTTASSYLLVVTPPTVSFPVQRRGIDAAAYVNIQHARRYAEVQAQLNALQAQGAIAGFTAIPSAYAFAVRSPNAQTQAALAQLGRLQTSGDLSAASVDELRGVYQRQLSAAIRAVSAGEHRQPQSNPAQQPLPQPDRPQRPATTSAGALGATDVTTPTFTVYLNDHYVYGNQLVPGTVVTFTLKTSSGLIKGSFTGVVAGGGDVDAFLYDVYGNAARAAAGDVLEVQTPDPITVPIVNLQVIPDAAVGRVTGFGPPNITSTDYATWPNLELLVPGAGFVTTAASGAFNAENLSWQAGQLYRLTYTNEQGNRVILYFSMPVLAGRGSHQWWSYDEYVSPSYVNGAVVSPYVPVTVTLTRAGSPVVVNVVSSGSYGWFALSLSDLYNNPVPILAGDTLQATDGVVTTTVEIKSFAVTSDPDTDTVSGTTDATVVTDTLDLTQTLSLWPASSGAYDLGKTVLAPGGSFSASNPFFPYADPDYSPVYLDWGPGQNGFLRYLDAQGNAVFDSFHALSPDPMLLLRGDYSYTSDNYVSGYADGACGYGLVTLLDSANAIKTQNNVYACSSFSTSFVDVYGNPLPILDGDSVTANFNGRTTTVQAPSLTMSADPKTEVVKGKITPGLVITTTYGMPQSLAVYPFPYPWIAPQNVMPDAEGDFSVDFAGQADIQPGGAGYAEYIDAKGNSVFAQWRAPFDKPVLHLRGNGGYYAENYVAVSLSGYSCSSQGINLVVKTEDGDVRLQQAVSVCGTMASLYLEDDFGNAINLNPGDVVQATFAGQTATAAVPSFDVTSDAENDTVAGVTNAGVVTTTANLPQTLAVWPMSTDDSHYGKHVALAAGGVFSATNPFYYAADSTYWEEYLDWGPGAQGHLRYIDAAGNFVYATFAAKVDQPLLRIEKDGNQVSGQIPESNAAVTVTVKSGAKVKGVGYAASDTLGYFWMNIFDGAGNPVRIMEGDEVVLAEPPATVAIPALSANADVENDRISGKGPANALLNVYVANVLNRSVATNANGDYILDLHGFVDLSGSDQIGVEYKNADGHLVWLERYAGAMVSAILNTNRVWGYAPDRSLPVTVTVKRGGTVIGADSFVNDGAYFQAFPISATGQPIILAAGDVVEVDFGAGVVKSLTLAALSLAINEQTDVVSGVGPANSLLAVSIEAFPDWYDTSAPTGADGKWSVNLAGQGRDIRPGDMANVRYSANGSDTTWLYGIAPVFWLRDGDDNYIRGYAVPYAPITITVKRNGGVLAVDHTEADGNGWYSRFLYDVNGLSANIQTGDIVEVQSVQTVSVTVPRLEIMVDGPARTVNGVGPANASLGLSTSAGNRTVQTDANGLFSTSFAAQTAYDLTWAEVVYQEPQGNWIYADAEQYVGNPAYLDARWDNDNYEYSSYAVSGSTGAGPRQVLLSLRRGGQVVATASAWAGSYGGFTALFHDSAGKTVDILAGDVIEMTAGDVAKSMTVPALTVQANMKSDTLYGTGPANTLLYSNWCGDTNVDAGGAWVLEGCDLDDGDDGYVYVTDLLGNSTFLGWSTPMVWVREYGSTVYGTSTLGAAVQVRLLRGAAVIAEANDSADTGDGWFEVEFLSAGGSRVIIQPNDVVVVDAGQPITVPVTPLTAVVDTAADRVTGVGPANEQLWVYAAGETRMVTAAADGSYIADFTGAADIRSGGWIEVWHINDEGNGVWLNWNAPLVRINLGSDIVDGYATPNATAALALKRGGNVIATAQAQTGPEGDFSAFFLDGSGNLIDLVAGDVVEVTASPTVTAAAIALTASLNAANDTIAGTGPAGAAILVVAHRCYDTGCNRTAMTAVANGAGAYTANFAGVMDLDQTSYAYVQATDAAGNQTSITTAPAETPQRTYVENMVLANGATLLMSAAGTANEGNLTPPLSFSAVGGGRFIFRASGGDLVVTAPDGTVTRPNNANLVVENPATGTWKVQVETWYGPGAQYAVAVGVAQYNIYMPAVQRQ